MSALTDIQAELVRRLRASTSVTDLVPSSAIVDGFAVPQTYPSIVVGEDQQVGTGSYINSPSTGLSEVYLTLHVWTRSTGFVVAKNIVGAIGAALRGLWSVGSAQLLCELQGTRFLRDPDGISQHAIMTFRIPNLCEVA